MNFKKQIKELADKVGVGLSDRSSRNSPAYDGVNIATNGWKGAPDASAIVHEIAHYAICPPERRACPDYGLGASPDTNRFVEMIVTPSQADREELFASVLGILYERKLGMDWKDTFHFHNWSQTKSSMLKFLNIARILRKEGYISCLRQV